MRDVLNEACPLPGSGHKPSCALCSGCSSGHQTSPAQEGKHLDCSFSLRLSALKAVRQQLRRKLADIEGSSPDADMALACEQAPGSCAHMALVGSAPTASKAEGVHTGVMQSVHRTHASKLIRAAMIGK